MAILCIFYLSGVLYEVLYAFSCNGESEICSREFYSVLSHVDWTHPSKIQQRRTKNGLKWNVMAQKRSLDKALSVGYPARVSRGMTLWPFILRSRSQTLRRINLNTPSFLNKLYGVPDCTADVFLEMPNANLPSGRASYQGISEGDVKDDDLKPRNKYKWCQDRQKYGKKSPKK